MLRELLHRRRLIQGNVPAPNTLYNGLILNMKMEDMTDETGNFSPVNYGATSVVGKLGNAYSFGSGDYVDLQSSNVLGGKSAFTFAAWTMKNTSSQPGQLYGSWGSPRTCSFRQDTFNRWMAYIYVDGSIYGGEFRAPGIEEWNVEGTWYLTIFQWDGTDFRVFVNDQESLDSYTVSGSAVNVGGQTERLGKSQVEPARDIDNVLAWNRALTPEERTSLYNNGNGVEL